MEYIEKSLAACGYRVKLQRRGPFTVVGYTLIVPPRGGDGLIGTFWEQAAADGRLEALRSASPVRPWVLGLGSWDPACEERGQRYTICIERTEDVALERLPATPDLFTKEIGASAWLCFELPAGLDLQRFWRDNPYRMMRTLGYRFHMGEHPGDYGVGLHIDAYPPDADVASRPAMEFWITVV